MKIGTKFACVGTTPLRLGTKPLRIGTKPLRIETKPLQQGKNLENKNLRGGGCPVAPPPESAPG